MKYPDYMENKTYRIWMHQRRYNNADWMMEGVKFVPSNRKGVWQDIQLEGAIKPVVKQQQLFLVYHPDYGLEQATGYYKATVEKLYANLNLETPNILEKQLIKSDFYLYTLWRFYHMFGFHFKRNWHFETICRKLEDIIVCKQKKNIIINIPPGYGKSEIISIGLTAYGMGMDPSNKFIVTSYGLETAQTFTAPAKDILLEDWHQELFPMELDRSTTAKKFFKTTAKGEVLAAGVGGKVTGHRAGTAKPGYTGTIISDDPVKAGDAQSDVKLKEACVFQDETLESRKFNGEVVKLIVMQRLNAKDPSGYMLERGWDHLCLPAILTYEQLELHCTELGIDPKTTESYIYGDVEADEYALWPWKLSLEEHREHRGDYVSEGRPGIGGFVFSGQYMQKPSPDGGGVIKTSWFRKYLPQDLPDFHTKVITCDSAWDDKTRNDYTVLQCWGKAKNGIYLIDQIRRKMDFPELKRVAVAFYKQHNPQKFYVENKQSGIALFQELRSEHMIPMFKLQAQKDKVTRANEASPWIESGFVYLPDEVLTPWVQELLDEVEDFPVGKHDDQVDTLVYAVRALLTDDQSLVPCDLSVPTRKELEATEDYAPVDLDNPWMN